MTSGNNSSKDKISININVLVDIMAALRHPETGCPWDIEQTSASIARYAIEEAYEVVDAIESEDIAALQDELGDLLLQVVFHARMAQEAGHFDLNDVICGISEKMRVRHPHVFDDEKMDRTADAQSQAWEVQKARERAAKRPHNAPVSALDDIASALPALMRAQKLQKRAAATGFDWPDAKSAAAKIDEEKTELFQAFARGNSEAMLDEAGDLLFSCVNVVRKMGIDAEEALRFANAKFQSRFEAMEKNARQNGESLDDMALEAMEALWQRAKAG